MRLLDKIINFILSLLVLAMLLSSLNAKRYIINVGGVHVNVGSSNSNTTSNTYDDIKNIKDSKYFQLKYSDFFYRPWSNTKLKIIKTAFIKNILYSLALMDLKTDKSAYVNGGYIPITKSFLNDVVYNMNLVNVGNIRKRGIVILPTNLKYLPTDVPFYSKRGGNYYFDYNQNYPLSINEPILISNYSKDNKWAFIETSYSAGWVKRANIAFIDDQILQNWVASKKAIAVTDNYKMLNQGKDTILYKTRIGDEFPITKITANYYLLLMAYGKDKKGYANYKLIAASKQDFITNYLKFSKKNFKKLENTFLRSDVKYNYRGKNRSRDSLVLVRNFYAVFGLWLPSNPKEMMIVGNKYNAKVNGYNYSSSLINKSSKQYLTLVLDKNDKLYIVNKNDEEDKKYQLKKDKLAKENSAKEGLNQNSTNSTNTTGPTAEEDVAALDEALSSIRTIDITLLTQLFLQNGKPFSKAKIISIDKLDMNNIEAVTTFPIDLIKEKKKK